MSTVIFIAGMIAPDNCTVTNAEKRSGAPVFPGLAAASLARRAPPNPAFVDTKAPPTPAPTNYINASLPAIAVKWGT